MSSALRRKKRRQKPKKRFDLTNMTKALEDMGFARGSFSCLGIVLAAEDGGAHFDLDDEDLTVEVELMPSQAQLTVRVGTVAGGGGGGIWKVPPVGAEVLVAVPDGDTAFQPTICSWYSSGQLPEDIGESTLVIACPAGGNVFIHDGSGSTRRLAFKDELDATNSHIDGHTHAGALGGTGSAPALTSPPTTNIAGTPLDPAPAAVGTDVLRSK